jgi:alkyl sulfatase BDS1-like metallo-beta-lactamase superfamily hydrolase
MNILFPDRRAVCLAENATHNPAMLAGGGLAGVGVGVDDPSTLERLMAVLDGPDPNFGVVTP